MVGESERDDKANPDGAAPRPSRLADRFGTRVMDAHQACRNQPPRDDDVGADQGGDGQPEVPPEPKPEDPADGSAASNPPSPGEEKGTDGAADQPAEDSSSAGAEGDKVGAAAEDQPQDPPGDDPEPQPKGSPRWHAWNNRQKAKGAGSSSPSPGTKKDEGAADQEVAIGSEGYQPDDKHKSGTWDDLGKENRKVRFLVEDWIAHDLLTGVVGDSKAGKSAYTLWALVKPIITGCDWFTGQKGSGKPGYVVWCDTERRLVLNLERAEKWGLPVDRILTPFQDKRGVVDINDPDHLQRIVNVVNYYKARLIVLDSYRGAHCLDENNSQTGVLLQRFAAICEQTRCAGAVLHHTRRLRLDEDLTVHCARGSSAFLAAVVSQIVIDRPDPQSEWRRVQVLGSNIRKAPLPRGFLITDKGLRFGEVPRRPPKPETETGEKRATQFLRAAMKPGEWYKAAQLLDEAEGEGISADALHRAKAKLGIRKPAHLKKEGGVWWWRLPAK